MRQHTKCGMLALSSFVWITSYALAGAPANSPEELIQDLVSAANKDDVEGFLGNLTDDSRKAVEALNTRRALLTGSTDHLSRIVTNKPANDLKSTLRLLNALEILSKVEHPDGSVELRLRSSIQVADGKTVSQEDTLFARKEGGSWRLIGWTPAVKVRPMSQPGTDDESANGSINVHRHGTDAPR
jgi:hypothetical protein